jgi:hypothetical protein
MRRYMLPETRHEWHWAQAQRRFGLSEHDVGEDDRARFFAEQRMLDEALEHWDRELAEVWRKKTKGIGTRPPATSPKGATRQWWDRPSVRDLDFERNIAIINLAHPLKARSTSHSTRRLTGRALSHIARAMGRVTRKSKNAGKSAGRLAPRTIEQIVEALRRILEAKGTHNFVICHADERKNYFVQFATGRGDTVVRAEAVSNKFLDPPFRLTDRQLKALRSMDWKPPKPKESPNFYRDWGKGAKDRLLMARHAIQTLVDVYEFPPDQELKIEVGFDKGK